MVRHQDEYFKVADQTIAERFRLAFVLGCSFVSSASSIYLWIQIPELSPIARDDEGNYEKRRKDIETYLQVLASRESLKQSSIFQ
jgi:hypothetical protein